MTDDQLISRARANPMHLPGCPISFEALWSADLDKLAKQWPRYGSRLDYDASSADGMLAWFLAYLTEGDRERTWRLMQGSALKRGKWENDLYKKALLDFACGERD